MTIDPLDLRTFPPVEPLSLVPETYRQTLLSKSTECLMSAYLYSKYEGGALTHPLAGGTVLHRAIERVIRHMLAEDERTVAPETAKDILNETFVASTDLTVGPERFDSMRSMMFHLAEGLVIPSSADKSVVVCLETPVTVELNGRKITGTIDYAETNGAELLIKDWKSAFHHAATAESEDDPEIVPTKAEWGGTFQLILYAYALATGSIEGAPDGFNFNATPTFRLRQEHPRQFWAREGVMAYREAVISRETLLDWRLYLEASVAKLDEAFRTWQFPAVMGSHCDFCPSSAECPIPAPLRDYRGELRTDDDVARAMLRKKRHDAISRQLWAAIKGRMKVRGGRVRFGRDEELFFKASESERVRKLVEVDGRKVEGRKALRDAIDRRNEGVPGEIVWSTYYTTSTSSRLSTRKLTDEELAELKKKGEVS